ncbi:MAG: hypothetical protein ACTS22_01710 [Phycisphaerales bacterium]
MPDAPSTLVPVADAVGLAAAHAMASALRAAGIQAFVFDTARTTLQWEAPRVIAPFQVHVARADARAAAAILEENRTDSVDIDWNDIDLGTPEDDTAAAIARSAHAPWLEGQRPNKRPITRAAFNATKLGILGWVFGSVIVAVVTAVSIIFTVF